MYHIVTRHTVRNAKLTCEPQPPTMLMQRRVLSRAWNKFTRVDVKESVHQGGHGGESRRYSALVVTHDAASPRCTRDATVPEVCHQLARIADMGQGSSSEHAHLTPGTFLASFRSCCSNLSFQSTNIRQNRSAHYSHNALRKRASPHLNYTALIPSFAHWRTLNLE
jgi:hypothetical protein